MFPERPALRRPASRRRVVAQALIVSERTVKSHISAIFTKLGVRDRAGAIVIAYEAGATDPT